MDQRNDRLRVHGIKFLFRKDARNQLARVAMAIFHGVNQWQRDFAFLQIAQHRLAKLLC